MRTNARFLSAGVLLAFTSSYGQTFFVSIFAAQIMAAYSLTDGQWGLTYTVATTASAVLMFWAGAVTDHFRVRSLAWIIIPALALACVGMAWNTSIIGLAVLVFLLRFLGQGMTSQLAVTAMARWFVAHRGLALSISAMGFAVGTALFPVLFATLLDHYHWRSLWLVAAALVIVSLPLVIWLLSAERTPQSHAESATTLGMDGKHWTRGEVIRSRFFWLLFPLIIGPPAWGTALFFQQVHIAETKGFGLAEYLALLPLLTTVSVIVMVVSGQLIDRFGSSGLIRIYLIPFAVSFLIISSATSLPVVAIGLMVFGIGAGMQATVPTAFWAEYFGTRYIGAIKAISASVMVLGSAIGPGVSGVIIDLGYSFPQQMIYYSAFFLAATGLVWLAVQEGKRRLPAPQIDVERA